MRGLLDGLSAVFDRLSFSACQGCQKDIGKQETGLGHVFAIRPLSNANAEATAATQRGARLLHEGRLDEAQRELTRARQLAFGSIEALTNLGCAYHMIGDEIAALQLYREAHAAEPLDDAAVMALAALEQRRSRSEEAQKLLMGFLQDVDASHVGVLRQLGRLYQDAGNWSKAAGCFHRLLTIEPGGAEWSAQLQLCLDQLPTKNDRGEPVPSPGGIPGAFARAFSFVEPIVRSASSGDTTQQHQQQQPSSAPGRRALGMKAASLPTSPSAGASARRHGGAGPPPNEEGPGGGAGGGGSWAVQLREAKLHREMGRPEAALEVYQALLRREGPHTAEALLGLADCRCDLGDLEGALEAAQQLLALQPASAEANLLVAELLLGAGHGAEMAEPYLSRAAEAAEERLGGGLAQPDDGPGLQLRVLCARAEAALEREDHSGALSAAASAVRLDACMPRALILLGAARLRVAEYTAALRVLSAARDNLGGGATAAHAAAGTPRRRRRLLAEAEALTAQAQERLRQYPQALASAQKALGLEPGLSMARVVHATALQASGQAREAERELEEVLQQHPQNAAARLQLGYSRLCAGSFAGAVASLEVLDIAVGVSRSQLGAAKAYQALALESLQQQPQGAGGGGGIANPAAEEAARDALSLHRNLQHVWGEIESGVIANPLEAVQRLRGICDLDLTTLQAKQLLRLMAKAAGRHDLLQKMASLAVPQRGRDGGGLGGGGSGGGGGASSRQASAPPPNRWATGAQYEGLRGVAGSGASTPTGDFAPHAGFRGGMLAAPTSPQQQQQQRARERLRSSSPAGAGGVIGGGHWQPAAQGGGGGSFGGPAALGEVPGRGSWALQGGSGGYLPSQPSTRAETPYGGSPHRGRSVSPGTAAAGVGGAKGSFGPLGAAAGGAAAGYGGGGGGGYGGGALGRGREPPSGGDGGGYAGGVFGQFPRTGSRPRVGGSRDTSLPRGGGVADARDRSFPRGGSMPESRDRSPSRSSAGEALSIGWNELIRPEQLVFGPQLGAGGSAQVFRGSWNGQEVAIKKIGGLAHLEEMKKEINALRRLRHPRLVRFIGACLQPPTLLVVTEFMSGGSLHDRLFGSRREPALSQTQRWLIASQMAEGLNFLHSQRVVHRDLKSMNILLDSRQNAKICDFGLAQQMDCSSTHIARSADGENGSPRYMAPECFDAALGKLTEKVDIWAMGCILLELFSGVLAYADCTTMAQLSARILVERRPPEPPAGLPGPLVYLLRRCTCFEASRRPAAADLHTELARIATQCCGGGAGR